MIKDPLTIKDEDNTIIFEDNGLDMRIHIKNRVGDRMTIHLKVNLEPASIRAVRDYLNFVLAEE